MTITRETPGVYIEEITGPGVIQGVSTSVAAFVGPTATGHVDRCRCAGHELRPVHGAVRRRWSSRISTTQRRGTPCYLSFALQGFFQNGGQRAHIARVSNGAAASARPHQRRRRGRGDGPGAQRGHRGQPDLASPSSRALGRGRSPLPPGHGRGRHAPPPRPAGSRRETRRSSTVVGDRRASRRATTCRSCCHRRHRSSTTRATSVGGRRHRQPPARRVRRIRGGAHVRGQRPAGRPGDRQHREDHRHADARRASPT